MPKQIKPSQLQIFYTLKADQITVGWVKPVKTMTFFNELTVPCHLDLLTVKLNSVIWIKFTWSFFPSTAFQVCNTTGLFESTSYFTEIFRDTKGMELTHCFKFSEELIWNLISILGKNSPLFLLSVYIIQWHSLF